MWSPTHVQVTVSQARNLIAKGKSGTNDAYVTIKLGDEKYQTSIKERSENPEWMEECDLPLVDMSGTIQLNVYHRNLLSIDEFLGHVDIPLEQFKIYERPRSRWYALRNKTGSKKAEKYRGEIEVKVTFIVQSMSGSHASLNKTTSSSKSFKRSSSIKTLAHSVGEKLTVKWPSKGSLTVSGSANSENGDQSPTVRKFDKRDLTRSHTILPTSFNNQHLQDDQQSQQDDLDSTGTNDDPKGHDLDRWTNPLAPFRRKKKSRLSKMNILSQSTLTLDAGKSSPSSELCNDSDLKDSRPLLHKPMLTKSMFDLSTPTIEEISGGISHSEVQHSDSENEMESENVTGNSKGDCSSTDPKGQGQLGTKENTVSSPEAGSKNNRKVATENSEFTATGGDFQERGIDVVFQSKAEIPKPTNRSILQEEKPKSPSSLGESVSNALQTTPPKPPRSAPKVKDSEVKVTGIEDAETREKVQRPLEPLQEHIDGLVEPAEMRPKDEQNSGSDSEGEEAPSPDSSSPESNKSKRRSGSYTKVPVETVTKETKKEEEEEEREEDAEDLRKDKYKRMKEVNRRHTIGRNVARAAAHELHAGIAEYKRAQEQKDRPLPEEVMDQFMDHSREDLVRLILEQRHLLHKKDTYNRDLEDYIDNLLVKVMEVTPKLLMHPSSRPSPPKGHRGVTYGFQLGGSTAPQSPAHSQPPANQQLSNQKQPSNKNNTSRKNIINANNSNNFGVITTRQVSSEQKPNKKPFNPFKKIQQALK